MPTIVELTSTGDRDLLLGAAYCMAHSARPNRLLGDLFPTEKHGQLHLVALCDAAGTVEWAHPSACRVVSNRQTHPATTTAPPDGRRGGGVFQRFGCVGSGAPAAGLNPVA